VLGALGIAVWPMVEFEADDALAAAAELAGRDPRVDRVLICTPDKDLAQCVRGTRVVQLDRRTRTVRDEAGVIARFGVPPASIPDYPWSVTRPTASRARRWGAKSAAASWRVPSPKIPDDCEPGVNAAGPRACAHAGRGARAGALLRTLATLRTDIAPSIRGRPVLEGPTPAFAAGGAARGRADR
jgi:hypothetical protein